MILQYRLLILFAILIFVYCWRASQFIIAPRRFISSLTPADFDLDYIPLKLLTRDNIELSAWFIPYEQSEESQQSEKSPTIIICHGFGGDKGDCLGIARFLHRAGFNVMMFDFRAHGQSKGKYCSLGYYETADIEAAINWLSEQGIDKIGAIGLSMGGTAALLTAANNPSLKAVVTDGSYISFWSAVVSYARFHFKAPKYPFIPPAVFTARMRLGFNPRNLNLANFLHLIPPRRAFIIHGALDREICVSDAYRIYSHLTTLNPHPIAYGSLWIVNGAGHLECYYVAKEEYEKRIISFFNSSFK